MTAYELWVPIVLLGLAGLGVLAFTLAGKRLDARLEAERQAKHPGQ